MKGKRTPTLVLMTILLLSFGCGEDKMTDPNGEETVIDIDGNVYRTVTIGTQVWMAENLKVTHYRNSDPIPNITDSIAWGDLTTGAYCNYHDDANYASTYGRLYNGYAVHDDRNIAPAGWHVPSDDEWKQLEMYLGMSQSQADSIGWRGTDEGGKRKEVGTDHWRSPDTGATNESGFLALSGGNRDRYYGYFQDMGNTAYFWTSTESDSRRTWSRYLFYDYSQVARGVYTENEYGFSIRCVRN